MRKLFSVLMVVAMLAISFASFAVAAPGTPGQPEELIYEGANTDNPSHPLGEKQAALKAKGLESKMNGKVNGPVAEAKAWRSPPLSEDRSALSSTSA